MTKTRSKQRMISRAMQRAAFASACAVMPLIGCDGQVGARTALGDDTEPSLTGDASSAPGSSTGTTNNSGAMDANTGTGEPLGPTGGTGEDASGPGSSTGAMDANTGTGEPSNTTGSTGDASSGPGSTGATDANTGDGSGTTGDPPPGTSQGKRCLLHLHGKSGSGRPTEVIGSVTHLYPNGNAEGWGGRQWLYFPDSGYEQIRASLADAIAAEKCDHVVAHGFSNGAAAAAKLFCRGETFSGTMLGYIVDDPVPDHGVDGCAPAAGVKVKLYWTGGLSNAVDGWDCAPSDWTCEGGFTIGIDKYAAALGVPATQSVNFGHNEYVGAPEESSWW